MSGKRKILICDDDGDICEATSIVLEKGGYEVGIIRNGRKIMEKVKEFNPDLVLLDVMMSPEEDGMSISKMLKKDKETSKIPVLLFTALNDPEKLASSAGADGFVEKPFDIHLLLETVNKNISNKIMNTGCRTACKTKASSLLHVENALVLIKQYEITG